VGVIHSRVLSSLLARSGLLCAAILHLAMAVDLPAVHLLAAAKQVAEQGNPYEPAGEDRIPHDEGGCALCHSLRQAAAPPAAPTVPVGGLATVRETVRTLPTLAPSHRARVFARGPPPVDSEL